jgi:hypothetical protein
MNDIEKDYKSKNPTARNHTSTTTATTTSTGTNSNSNIGSRFMGLREPDSPQFSQTYTPINPFLQFLVQRDVPKLIIQQVTMAC